MRENKEKIINALVITVIATLFFFALTFILFNFLKIETSLKEAWETLGSFFGGITTLVAAYVASRLFNDWKEQERITFIRDIAHDTANLMTQLILSMQQYPRDGITEIKVLHSKITTNLSFLNLQIKDDEINKVNENFGVFMADFYSILIHAIDDVLTPEQTKKEINENITSFKVEYAYIANLIDIDKIYEKIKNLQPKTALT